MTYTRHTLKNFLAILFFFCVLFFFTPCYAAIKDVSLQQVANTHHLKIVSSSPDKFILRGNNIELVFKNSSRTFLANGIITPLGFPCSLKKRQLTIAYNDYTTHVLPFLGGKTNILPQSMIIVLDPGHGGHDNGAICNSIKEKNITLDIAQRVAKKLTDCGHKVILTRNVDNFITLDQRTNIANQQKASIFVSIHCNSAESKTANGIETFVLTPYGQPSYNRVKTASCDFKRCINNKFDQTNLILAYNIQKTLVERLRANDRGIKHSRFHVLKALNCPGILIECGFLSNLNDRQKLSSEKYRQALAGAIFEGIIKFSK